MPADLELDPIELAERRLFLPGEENVESLGDRGLGDLLPKLLGEAIAGGELPPSTDVRTVMLAVASVFFGVPLVLGRRAPDAIEMVFRRQLALVWAGARATGKETST
jgi:hypothetical protein